MLKKLWRNISIAFYSFFYGMRSADKIITASGTDDLDANDVGGIEQQQEKDSVYQDLLKGVVTERVRELRHEMYYAERKSKEYEYSGGGRAKKNSMFDFQGNVDKSDGFKIIVVQENDQLTTSMLDAGVYAIGDKVDVDQFSVDNTIRNRTKLEKEYRITIKRNFLPSFALEKFARKIVVKHIEGKKFMLDLYVTKYINKLEPTSKLFHTEMEKLYMGLDRSDCVEFDQLSFTTHNAYGSPDLVTYTFKDIEFDSITEFDGNYVLKFLCEIVDAYDMVEKEFYDEKTAEKNEKHEMRDGATINFDEAKRIKDMAERDVSEEESLLASLTEQNPTVKKNKKDKSGKKGNNKKKNTTKK